MAPRGMVLTRFGPKSCMSDMGMDYTDRSENWYGSENGYQKITYFALK